MVNILRSDNERIWILLITYTSSSQFVKSLFIHPEKLNEVIIMRTIIPMYTFILFGEHRFASYFKNCIYKECYVNKTI